MTADQIKAIAVRYKVSEDTVKRYWLTNPAIRESLIKKMNAADTRMSVARIAPASLLDLITQDLTLVLRDGELHISAPALSDMHQSSGAPDDDVRGT